MRIRVFPSHLCAGPRLQHILRMRVLLPNHLCAGPRFLQEEGVDACV